MKNNEKPSAESTRPEGWLGKLFDEAGQIPRQDRANHIRQVAQRAVAAGILDEKKLAVLQNRFPLPGFERKTLREIGEGMNLTRETIRRIEYNIFLKLKKLLKEI